jgi:putative LysE/RhtB family amino acid efflux pump
MSISGLARLFGSAFLIGFAASAPIGPVNMMAIRRGLLGGPRHTMAFGAGAILGDLTLFSLAHWGGHHFTAELENGRIRSTLALVGLLVLLPFGVYFLVSALKNSKVAHKHERELREKKSVPGRLLDESAFAFLLTVVNPLGIVYWIGVASSWIPTAYSMLGPDGAAWGILAAAAGMVVWFGILVVLVSFVPDRLSATFFRWVNAALGIVLIGFSVWCAMLFIHPGIANISLQQFRETVTAKPELL